MESCGVKTLAVCLAVVALGFSGFVALKQKKIEAKIDTMNSLLEELEYAPGNIEELTAQSHDLESRCGELENKIKKIIRERRENITE